MPHPSGLLNSRVMRSSGEDVNALRGYWETLSEGGAVSVPPREADVGRRVRDVRGPVPDRLDGQHRPTAGLRSVRLAPSGTLATGVNVRGLSSLALASIVGVLAVTLAAGTTTAGAAAPESVSNITNDDFHFSNDEAPGSVGTWLFSVYEQHGLRSRARVVANDDDLVQVDGSLRLATPGEGDRIALRHLTSCVDDVRPQFAEFRAGGYSFNVVRGETPAQYTLDLTCPGPGASYVAGDFTLAFAGPYPTDASSGWQTVDVVQGGSALWEIVGGDEAARPLDEHKARCPSGVIRGHGLELATPGSVSLVDAVRFNDETTNFMVPWLTRVHGQYYRGRAYADDQRVTDHLLDARYFIDFEDGGVSDGWANPARRRNGPRSKALVIANQNSQQSVLVAGPLANAVRGRLRLETAETVDPLQTGGYDYVPARGKVFLVGFGRKLSRKVAAQARDGGADVVIIDRRDPYTNAVQAARIIDRRRPARIKRTVLLTSAKPTPAMLAISAAAGKSKGAVLLTDGRRMPAATRRYLDSHRAAVYAVGRAASHAAPGLPRNHRIVGTNRYSTAIKVAKRFFAEPGSVVIASGGEYVDALLAGAYGGNVHAPVLLVRKNGVPPVVARYIRAHRGDMRDSVLVGGRSRISTATFNTLRTTLTRR